MTIIGRIGMIFWPMLHAYSQTDISYPFSSFRIDKYWIVFTLV